MISSHDTANNAVLNAEIKTEKEITELSKEYSELAEQIVELDQELKGEFKKKLDNTLDRQ